MQFVPLLAMLALVVKVTDFLRYAANRDLNGIVTQLVVWLAGVLVVLLGAHTAWAASIDVAGTPLSGLGFWSCVFTGMSVASTGSLTKDTLKSIDNTNSSAIPTLLPAGPRRGGPRTPGAVPVTTVG